MRHINSTVDLRESDICFVCRRCPDREKPLRFSRRGGLKRSPRAIDWVSRTQKKPPSCACSVCLRAWPYDRPCMDSERNWGPNGDDRRWTPFSFSLGPTSNLGPRCSVIEVFKGKGLLPRRSVCRGFGSLKRKSTPCAPWSSVGARARFGLQTQGQVYLRRGADISIRFGF